MSTCNKFVTSTDTFIFVLIYISCLLCHPSKKTGHILLCICGFCRLVTFFVSDQKIENAMICLLHTLFTHPSWVADKPYRMFGHWVKDQGGIMFYIHLLCFFVLFYVLSDY